MGLRMLQLAVWDYSFSMHLMPLLRACRAEGYEVVCAGVAGPFVDEIAAEGFRYVPLPFSRSARPDRHLRALIALTRLLRRERFDVVHAHTFVAGLVGRVAARISRVPVCAYTAHGFRFHEGMGPVSFRIHLGFEALAARWTDYLFVQNDEDRVTALSHGLVDRERIRTIGNGIDLSRFSRSRLDPAALSALRRELDLPEEARVVTTIARPTREKGLYEFLEIAESLSAMHPDVHFLAVLPKLDGERHSIERAIERSRSPRLKRLGFRRDIPEILALTDVFVLPSHFEGYSRVIMEAMAMGVPVVASNVRGCRGLVRNGVCGMLVEPGEIGEFVEASSRLLADEKLRTDFGRAARGIAEEQFDLDASVKLQTSAFEMLTRDLRPVPLAC